MRTVKRLWFAVLGMALLSACGPSGTNLVSQFFNR
jgi:hypothetical protein